MTCRADDDDLPNDMLQFASPYFRHGPVQHIYRVWQKNLTVFKMKLHNDVSPFYVKAIITGKLSTCHFKFWKSLRCLSPFLKRCFSLTPRFSITRRNVSSLNALDSSQQPSLTYQHFLVFVPQESCLGVSFLRPKPFPESSVPILLRYQTGDTAMTRNVNLQEPCVLYIGQA